MANSKQNASAPVEETLNQSEAFFLKYKNVIMGCVLALVVIVAGVMLYKNYVSGPAELNASTAIAKGQDYFSRQQFELALNGDSTGYAGFAKIASEHRSTAAGNLANLSWYFFVIFSFICSFASHQGTHVFSTSIRNNFPFASYILDKPPYI